MGMGLKGKGAHASHDQIMRLLRELQRATAAMSDAPSARLPFHFSTGFKLLLEGAIFHLLDEPEGARPEMDFLDGFGVYSSLTGDLPGAASAGITRHSHREDLRAMVTRSESVGDDKME